MKEVGLNTWRLFPALSKNHHAALLSATYPNQVSIPTSLIMHRSCFLILEKAPSKIFRNHLGTCQKIEHPGHPATPCSSVKTKNSPHSPLSGALSLLVSFDWHTHYPYLHIPNLGQLADPRMMGCPVSQSIEF